MNTKNIANRLIETVKEEREKTRRIRQKIIADWEEEFDTAFLGDLWNTEHIQILIDALVKREEE